MFCGPNILRDSVTPPDWEKFKKWLLILLLSPNPLDAELASFKQSRVRQATIKSDRKSSCTLSANGRGCALCVCIYKRGIQYLLLLYIIILIFLSVVYLSPLLKTVLLIRRTTDRYPFFLSMECIAIWKNSRRFLFPTFSPPLPS